MKNDNDKIITAIISTATFLLVCGALYVGLHFIIKYW